MELLKEFIPLAILLAIFYLALGRQMLRRRKESGLSLWRSLTPRHLISVGGILILLGVSGTVFLIREQAQGNYNSGDPVTVVVPLILGLWLISVGVHRMRDE